VVTARPVITAILAVQGLCAVFFVGDVLSSALALRSTPVSWQVRELLELGAALGLVLGLVLGAMALHRTARGRAVAEARLRRAGIAFRDLLAERFESWGLTPAEADVATFAIKGMSTGEIAALRGVAEGTVKAQTAAIYRKAGVSGRGQLLALFIEDMMREEAPPQG
jgi:DNA-binding CsgD family transcriptional regulator